MDTNSHFYKSIDILYIDFIKLNWKFIVLVTIVNMLIYPAIQILQPKILTAIFENLSKITKTTDMFDFYSNYKNKTSIYYLYIYIIVWLLIIGFHLIKNSIDFRLQANLHVYNRTTIHDKILERYKNDYKDININNITTMIHHVNRLSIYCWNFLASDYIPQTVTMIFIIFYFLYHDIPIFLYLTFSIVLSYVIYFLTFDLYNAKNRNRELGTKKVYNKLGDDINNLMNIYINNTINEEKEIFKELNKKEVDFNIEIKSYENITAHLNQFVVLAMYGAVFFRLIHLLKIKKKDFSFVISSFIILNTVIYSQFDIIWKIQSVMFWFMSTIDFYSNYINDILLYENNNNFKNNINNGKIVFDNICFKYSKDDSKYLFKDFSLIINSNDKVAIIGRSGSGKTTLMKMIVDLHRPQKGDIYIDNINVKNIDNEYLRNKVMYVNQRTVLFDKSVMYNIKYGNEDISDDKILKIIQKYELQSIYQELENGLQTNSGINGNNLSLGMQKTTIILRSIINKSKIIIMDEPLAGLDNKTRQKIIKLIISECKDKTLIVITHDKEILPYMNKRINLQSLKND